MGSTEHWDRYWQASGSLNSFGETETSSGYKGELLTLWQQFFAALPCAATVVDIGTGNGAIAVAARQFSDSTQKHFAIFGTDAAKINPQLALQQKPELAAVLATIKFIANCKIEQLPFANNSIDLITSQFAFEYASAASALAECVRVLKPGGQLIAVVHHQDSMISQDSRCGLAVLELLLHKTAFFNIAAELFEQLTAKQQDEQDQQLQQQCQRLNKSLLTLVQQLKSQLQAGQQHWFDDALAKFAKLLINFKPENRQRLQFFQADLQAFYARLAEQVASAYSTTAMQQLLADAAAISSGSSAKPLHLDQQLFGWIVTIRK